MSGSPPVRLALVGAGRIAKVHERAVRGSGAELVAVVDVEPAAADSLARTAGCSPYPSLEGALASTSCEGVVVCTPPVTHAALAHSSVAAGIPVLCEKPLSVALEPAQRMLEEARQADVLLALASKFRFVEDVARAQEMVASGVVGDPLTFEVAFTSFVAMADRWNSRSEVSGGGVVIDNGCHAFDLVRCLLGPLTEVTSVEARRIQDLEVEDTADLLVRTWSGAVGHVQLSWSLDQRREAYLEVYGTRGAIVLGWRGSRYRTGPGSDWLAFGHGYDKQSAMEAQMASFCRSVRHGVPFPVAAEDALASMAATDATYASLGEGRTMRIDLPALAESRGHR